MERTGLGGITCSDNLHRLALLRCTIISKCTFLLFNAFIILELLGCTATLLAGKDLLMLARKSMFLNSNLPGLAIFSLAWTASHEATSRCRCGLLSLISGTSTAAVEACSVGIDTPRGRKRRTAYRQAVCWAINWRKKESNPSAQCCGREPSCVAATADVLSWPLTSASTFLALEILPRVSGDHLTAHYS